MRKRTRTTRIVVLMMVIVLSLLGCIACVKKQEPDTEQELNTSKPQAQTYTVVWMDADGSLLEYLSVDSDYDPTTRDLPSSSDQWEYTGWETKKRGYRIECIALRVKKEKIQWVDAEGTLLKEEFAPAADINQFSFPLPNDSDEWHYTEWKQEQIEDVILFTAQRVRKIKCIWKDADGTVLKEEYILDGQEAPQMELPPGNEKWEYLEWECALKNGQYIYTAMRKPNNFYFVGNVFQIVVKDLQGKAIGTGSGFVINDDGWFVTNNHVMEQACTAAAFFDIPDQGNGNRYTQLEILGGVYNSNEKDIFIGKLSGYEKIKSHYHNITFAEEYAVGEKSYSVGYPNSSVKMEINEGQILEEYSDIYDKINGIYYVLSDSYIAPGSSGGILINESFEVIGITTIGFYMDENKTVYRAGGSIPTFVISVHLKELDSSKIQVLTEIYK